MEANFNTLKLLIIILPILSRVSLAQEQSSSYEFRVIAAQGNNVRIQSGQRLWAGSLLKADDIIQISIQGYLGLMHRSGRTLELKTPGTYSVADLSRNLTGNTKSLAEKYIGQVVSEMKKNEQIETQAAHRRYMAITGAVERHNQIRIQVLLPDEPIYLLEPQLMLCWLRPDTLQAYTFNIVVRNMNPEKDEIVGSFITRDTTFLIDISQLKPYAEESGFIVQLTTLENPRMQSREAFVDVERNTDKRQVAEHALEQVPEEPGALNTLLRASVLKQHGYVLDAIKYYLLAIRQAPDVPLFYIGLLEYLSEQGIAYKKVD